MRIKHIFLIGLLLTLAPATIAKPIARPRNAKSAKYLTAKQKRDSRIVIQALRKLRRATGSVTDHEQYFELVADTFVTQRHQRENLAVGKTTQALNEALKCYFDASTLWDRVIEAKTNPPMGISGSKKMNDAMLYLTNTDILEKYYKKADLSWLRTQDFDLHKLLNRIWQRAALATERAAASINTAQ